MGSLLGVPAARTRLGYAWDNYLFYATVGLAVLGAKTNLSTLSGLTCGSLGVIGGLPGELKCSGSNKRIGGTLGAGVEYGFTPHWRTFYPSHDIRINFGALISGQTGRLFLPFDALIGARLTDKVQLSLDGSVPIVKDYPVYNFKTEARLRIVF